MIMIPSAELTGLLGDVVHLAHPDGKVSIPWLSCVHLSWDGEMVHTMATDRYKLGWSSWHPDDLPDGDVQDDIITTWGGDDEPWQIVIPLADARHLIKAYKVPKKLQRVPIGITVGDGLIEVLRSRDSGRSAVRVVIKGTTSEEMPDIPKLLSEHDTSQATRTARYDADGLAAFARVRSSSALEMTFDGKNGLTKIAIGDRFVGAIVPVRRRDD